MKSFLLAALCLHVFFSGYSQPGYTVRTKISNPDKYPLILAYFSGGKFTIDTNTVMEDGWRVFHGKVAGPVVASLVVRNDPALAITVDQGLIPGPSLEFFLTNEPIRIVGEAHTVYMATVKGGTANGEWASIKPQEQQWTKEGWLAEKNAYETFRPGADSVLFKRADKLRDENEQKTEALRKNFMKSHPHSLVSMYFLSGMLNTLSFEELKASYAGLGNEWKSSEYGMRVAEKVHNMEVTAIGQLAVPIDKKDMNGAAVNLGTLKGKYVLIDFWGSWCGPCRRSHPFLRQLYNKYKDKGLEIVGIAEEQFDDLEKDRAVWLNAIKEDSLSWIQVLNNEGKNSFDAVKAYGVTAFPTKILLDKDGRIIDRIVGDDEGPVTARLKQVFGE